MKYFFEEGEKDSLSVRNRKSTSNVVVLLPVTRVGPKYEAKWARVIDIIERSKANALIIIDKTPNGEASVFFRKNFDLSDSDLYVARRSLNEAIHDSQGFINLDKNLWILQIHDDDEWDGIPYIPESADKLDFFEVDFYIEGKDGRRKAGADDSPPARVIFSLLPALIWNRFAEFIKQEGGHVAGSVDSTLNLVTRLSCRRSQISGFTYVYDDRHWSDRKIATKHLLKLASEDGWGRFTSVEISLVNRSIDGLAALSFFGKFIPNEEAERARAEVLGTFKPSTKKRWLIVSRISLLSVALVLLRFVSIGGRVETLAPMLERVGRIHEVDKLLRHTWEIDSVQDVLTQIEEFHNSGEFPLLERRFSFWKEQLSL